MLGGVRIALHPNGSISCRFGNAQSPHTHSVEMIESASYYVVHTRTMIGGLVGFLIVIMRLAVARFISSLI